MKSFALFLSIVPLAMVGCDQLKESFLGQPNPNATAITPVGPSGSNDTIHRTEMAAPIFPNDEANKLQSPPSPFVTAATAQELQGNDPRNVIQSGGASNDIGILASANNFEGNTGTLGMQVSSSDPTTPSSDGKIYINSANLKFVNDLEVAAQSDGLVIELDADEGDVLATNTLMIQLDDRLAKSELEVTKKEYEAAVEKAKDDSEIQYSVASNDVAREEYATQKRLSDKGAGTDVELNKKWLEWKRADLAIEVAKVKKKEADSAVGVSSAKQGAAEVQVQLRKIIAPFDGIVAEKKKEKHDWVRAGDVILRLVSMEQLRVVGQVRVAQLSAAPHELVGSPANVEIELYPGKVERVSAKVGFVSPVMDLSGGYRIWLQIANKKVNDQWIFREGMPAKIEIQTR